jgi:hypothetical protein
MTQGATNWFLFEAALPLFGAAVMFLFLGICYYLVLADKTKFTYGWGQAIDSFGWLYGGLAIALREGIRGWPDKTSGILPFMCFAGAAVCFFLLVTAMTERGKDANWKPPVTLKVSSGILVAAILVAGIMLQNKISLKTP